MLTWLRCAAQYGWVAQNNCKRIEAEMHLHEDLGVRRILVPPQVFRGKTDKGRHVVEIFLDQLTRIHR